MTDASPTHALTSSGYRVSKRQLDEAQLDRMVDELTVTVGDSFIPDPKSDGPTRFCLAMESNRFLYLPKAYGLKTLGVPSKVSITEPVPIDVPFVGSLMDQQRAPLSSYLQAARDPERMGGILQLPPGFGKTVLALHIVATLGVKTLIMVHKEFLMDQWIERIQKYLPSARVGRIKQKTVEVDEKDIVLASIQSVCMREYEASTFEGFGMVIVDECHHIGAQVFSRSLPKVNFRYALGLSATVQRKDGLTRVFKWFLGDIVHRISSKQNTSCAATQATYRPRGAPIDAYGMELYLANGRVNIARMINVLASCADRTKFVIERLVTTLQAEPTRNVIVLSDRRTHLETMKRALDDLGYDCGLYVGGMSSKLLDQSKECRIILGTYSMVSEGFDLAKLDTLVLATPKGDVEQSVGRIQRKQSVEDADNVPLIIDVVDDYSMFKTQAEKRRRFYTKRNYIIQQN